MTNDGKKQRGRPARPMPERIDASPEEIAKAFLRLPADHKWEYLEESQDENS